MDASRAPIKPRLSPCRKCILLPTKVPQTDSDAPALRRKAAALYRRLALSSFSEKEFDEDEPVSRTWKISCAVIRTS